MPENETNTGTPDTPVTPVKKRGKGLAVVLLLACLAGGGVAANFFLRGGVARQQEQSASTKIKGVLHLDDFVVNLADSENRAYAKIGVEIGQYETPKNNSESGPSPVPAIRDAILTVIAGYRSDELLTAEGKLKLKRDLLQAVQQRAPAAHAGEIYFTEFLVQR